MATRYWIGGSGSFGDTAHWSLSSGGAGGASAPGGSDDAKFDANSFSVNGAVVTITNNLTLLSLDASSVNHSAVLTISSIGSLSVGTGNCTLSSLFSISSALFPVSLQGGTVTLNGGDIGGGVSLVDVTLSGNFVVTSSAVSMTGTIVANGNVSSPGTITIANSAVITMGSGTWSAQSLSVGTGVTINPGTSILSLTQSIATSGADYTFYDLIAPSGITFGNVGNLTFNDFEVTSGTVTFKSTKSVTVAGTFTANGTPGTHIVIAASTPGSAATLSAAVIDISNLTVRDNTASGAAADFHVNFGSIDGGGNTAWVFFTANDRFNAGTEGILTIAPPQGTRDNPVIDGSNHTARRVHTLQDSAGILAHLSDISTPPIDNQVATQYGSGTPYSLTTSPALIALGTDTPSMQFGLAGQYLIFARVRIDYNAATFAAVRTVTLKLRRTNNTAADIASSPTSFKTQIITTLTFTAGIVCLPPILYNTANTDDIIQIWGSINTGPTAGSIDAVEAEIVALVVQ